MAKKKTTTKKTVRRRVPEPEPRPAHAVYTYKVIAAGKPDELVQCHSLNIYGDSADFQRLVPTPRDPEGDWNTVLAIPTRCFDRIELVEDVPAVERVEGWDVNEVPVETPQA